MTPSPTPRRIGLLLAGSLFAAVATAQDPLLEIAHEGSGWVTSVSAPGVVSDFRFRLTAEAGGWYVLGISPYANRSQAWLAPTPAFDLSAVEDLLAEGNQQVVLPRGMLDSYLRLGTRDPISQVENPRMVQGFYVPLLQGSGSTPRLWSSQPEMWYTTLNAYGPQSRAIWQSMTRDYPQGTIGDPELFLAESMFRWSLLLRHATTSPPPAMTVNEFLHSNEYAAMVTDGDPWNIGFHAQPIWLKAALPVTPGPVDRLAPTITLPPRASVSNGCTIPLRFPLQFTAPFTLGLTGPAQPGETRYFTLAGAIPPLTVEFRTATGVTFATAYADIDRVDPLRYRVTIPLDVAIGTVRLKDRRPGPFFDVGTVTSVQRSP